MGRNKAGPFKLGGKKNCTANTVNPFKKNILLDQLISSKLSYSIKFTPRKSAHMRPCMP